MATLYDINKDIEDALANAIDDDGEIINEEAFNSYEELAIAREEKIENLGLFIKNLLSDVEAYKIEKQNFDKKMTQAKKRAEWLKSYLTFCLNGEKFKSTRVAISYRKSESVEINPELIDPKWLKTIDATKEENYRKSELKEALKNGEEINGAQLVEKNNITIK